jgi:hypothetical protein
MAEATARPRTRARSGARALLSGTTWCVVALLALVVAAELAFFAIHAAHMLSYPYPLDYGEGPLLAQVNLLRAGTPVWQLYSDPGMPPYAVVNYPPVYHMLAALVAAIVGDTLLAGRLVSLVATLAAVAALWWLTADRRPPTADDQSPTTADEEITHLTHDASRITHHVSRNTQYAIRNTLVRSLIVLAFLGLPIVREWAVVMRVDMLGLALGLWGLALARPGVGWRGTLWAALPLALSLFAKPSLIAAPTAVLLWLLFRDWRRALLLGLTLTAAGGLVFVALQRASGGWFAIHVLTANNNAFQFDLAHGFWHDQLAILWPLLAPAALLALAVILAGPRPTTDHRPPTTDALKHLNKEQRLALSASEGTKNTERKDNRQPTTDNGRRTTDSSRNTLLLPLYYTLFGAIVAFGVGKVGAYANYFLEFYAGLVWIAAVWFRPTADYRSVFSILRSQVSSLKSWFPVLGRVPSGWPSALGSWRMLVAPLCVLGALLRYYPLWSETYLKPYGMIEQQNPPRVALGQYGVWKDLQRERAILATFGGVNAALNHEVRAAGGPIFTDVPGVAAQAGQLARLQAFEHRQLYDVSAWDQRPLLRDLANGRVPLVVLDYLGNWMTPEMIAIITHRYAQDGSLGTYDLYRPVAVGSSAAADLGFPQGLHLVGYHLALSAGRPVYAGGETVLLTLDWKWRPNELGLSAEPPWPGLIGSGRDDVVAQLIDDRSQVLAESARPLLYGALRPRNWVDDGFWGGEVMQHLQPLALPARLPAGSYRLVVTLRRDGRELALPRALTTIVVEEQSGQLLGEQGYFVPAPLLDDWRELGGYDGPGDPLMPAAPFAGYTLQCFARDCLRLGGRGVERLPLGELIRLIDAGLQPAADPVAASPATTAIQDFPETDQVLSGIFLAYWRENGGMARFGPPISGELLRGDRIVQYTRYARLERPAGGGAVRLGRLGEEYLRLPGGVLYRWP